MSISHHPSDETLFLCATGQLDEGHSLITRTHLEFCPQCRDAVEAYASLGGAALEAMTPEPLAQDALARTLQKLASEESTAPAAEPSRPHPKFLEKLPEGFELPATIRGYNIGKWRALAPGVQFSSFPIEGNTRGMFLRARAGAAMPVHSHDGKEYTIILHGSFSDEMGRMRRGDMTEYDDSVTHRPIVSDDGECICLFVFEGKLKIHSLIGRMVQPLMGL